MAACLRASLVFLISVATHLSAQNAVSSWCGIIGYALNATQASRSRTDTHAECYRSCEAEPACESVNYIQEGGWCETNAASHRDCPASFVASSGAVYSSKRKTGCGGCKRDKDCTHSSHLEAHYAFENNFLDSTSAGRNGILSGSAAFIVGVCGKGASFSGASKVVVDAFRNFRWGSEFSVSAWFNRASPSGYMGLVNSGYAWEGSWEIRMTDAANGQEIGGGLYTDTGSSHWAYITQIPSLTLNQWHHVIMTYDGTEFLFYVDNVLQSGYSDCCIGDIVPKDVPVTIAQAGIGHPQEYLVGSIDEVKIFTRVLCAEEVDKMFRFPCTC